MTPCALNTPPTEGRGPRLPEIERRDLLPVVQRAGRLRSDIGTGLTLPSDKVITPPVPLAWADLGDFPSRLLFVSVEPARVIKTKSQKRQK